MGIIRITKEFAFEMAHALEGYDGACSQIHGHSYRFFVTVKGTPSNNPDDPKFGMVMDFGALKSIVNKLVINEFDHSFVILRSEHTLSFIKTLKERFERVVVVDYQPTCENMVARFATQIAKELPPKVTLHSLRLHETATSFAEWFAEDNT